MPSYRTPPNLRPKISSLPPQHSEVADSLNLYKLAIEKKRIQQELSNLDQRRQQLLERLCVIDTQSNQLVENLQQQQANQPTNSQVLKSRGARFDAFLLEY